MSLRLVAPEPGVIVTGDNSKPTVRSIKSGRTTILIIQKAA